MQKIQPYTESSLIESFAQLFPRANFQLNKTNESDAEIILLNGIKIALTTDNITEEIERGIYSDPLTMGWMTVVANLSDLAAVGATPAGILLNETFKESWSKEFIMEIQEGIKRACIKHHVHVLGGDTNFSSVANLGATAIGTIENGLITRKGCAEGDFLFSTGKLGAGNCYGFQAILGNNNESFMPLAKIEEGKIISRFASACIDSSDGLFHALCTLHDVNEVGFSIDASLPDIICDEGLLVSNKSELPAWIFMAGIIGEYELIFTVAPEKREAFLSEYEKQGYTAVFLGKVSSGQNINFRSEQHKNISVACNMFKEIYQFTSDPNEYINQLLRLEKE